MKLSVRDNLLTFFRIEGDDEEEFRLRVWSDGRAELTLHPSDELLQELKDEGIPLPKPIALRRIR